MAITRRARLITEARALALQHSRARLNLDFESAESTDGQLEGSGGGGSADSAAGSDSEPSLPRRSGRKRKLPLYEETASASTLPPLLGVEEGRLLSMVVFGPRVWRRLPQGDQGARVSH
eukprot:TRINITY_DN9533_c0_g3_i1.p1 TRINITY_DN9533_c0_g3~~TRINITY_DN9533_c0_g3_i1.p1  ORF type:complete len:119 (-),score=34.30 TRINITY_DN9533_c0_g3_i1:635-991(-)